MLPSDPAARKAIPLCTGVLDYFPDALAAVAACSQAGNDQHNPGEPLHWARAKSGDEADALLRHLAQRGTVDSDGIRHSAKAAWRALALLQKELEAAGAPLARGAREEGRASGLVDGDICIWDGVNFVLPSEWRPRVGPCRYDGFRVEYVDGFGWCRVRGDGEDARFSPILDCRAYDAHPGNPPRTDTGD